MDWPRWAGGSCMYRIGVSSHLTWLFLSYVGRPGSEHSRSMTRRGARPLALTFRSPGMRYGDMAWVKDTNWEQHLSPAEARARPKVSVVETIRNSSSCSVWYFFSGWVRLPPRSPPPPAVPRAGSSGAHLLCNRASYGVCSGIKVHPVKSRFWYSATL